MKFSCYFLGLFLVITMFTFCKEKENNTKNYIGDTINLPKISKILYKDSLYQKNIFYKDSAKLKITTYLKADCHTCIMDLLKWEKYFQYFTSKKELKIYFYFNTKNLAAFRHNINKMKADKYPLIYDQKNKYLENNKLPLTKKQFQTFLLNSNNEVILVGNPLYNEKLMKLYKKEINKRLE